MKRSAIALCVSLCAVSAFSACEDDYEKLSRDLEHPGKGSDAGRPSSMDSGSGSGSSDSGTRDAGSEDAASEASDSGDAAAGDAGTTDAGDAATDAAPQDAQGAAANS